MEDAEEQLLASVEQIIDDGHAVATIQNLFGIPQRQGELALRQIRKNFAISAHKAGLPIEEFIARVDDERKMAIFGFCTGVVCQRDYEQGLDPATGERKHPPEYEI
jgi:hypothetical protein